VTQQEQDLLPRLQALKAAPPFWGDRRLWAYWRFVAHLPVNRTRLWRLRREHQLFVPPDLRLKAQRTPSHSKPRPLKPHAWWGIDMTKVVVQGFGWVDLVVLLDG
jgi:hypothetical protein